MWPTRQERWKQSGCEPTKGIETCDGHRFQRPSPAVCSEESLQSAAVHSTTRNPAVLALMRIIDHIRWVYPERRHEVNTRVPGRTGAVDPTWCRLRPGTFVRGSHLTGMRCPRAR